MGERYGCFFIIGIRKLERIHIFYISYITFRCLIFLYGIGMIDRQVCCEFRSSIFTCSSFFNQSAFLYNHYTIGIFNIVCRIQSENATIQCFLCVFVLFYYGHLCFLTLIVKSHISKHNFFILSGISQCHCLFLAPIIEVVWCFCFFYHISSEMEILQSNRAILTCCQIFLHQITFAVHFCTISSYDIRSGIHVINSIFLSAVLILEYSSIFTDFCSGKHLSFFVNSKLCKLLHIRYCCCGCLVCYQIHIVGSGIDAIAIWCCNFFQINSFLCLYNLHCRSTIFICCRHFRNQLCAGLIFINTEDSSCQFCIFLLGIYFYYRNFCLIQLNGRLCFTGFWCIRCLFLQESDILCIRNL